MDNGHAQRERSIPAWAGETRRRLWRRGRWRVYPRVGGGNDGGADSPIALGGLSPRGRGKRCKRRLAHRGARSIPAWAGETLTAQSRHDGSAVYPRVGGGNSALCAISFVR